MDEKILKLGIIGAGNIASVVSKALNGFPHIRKYAVASRNYERASIFRVDYGFDKAYGSYDELIYDNNIDLVYIATPHAFHYEQMLACIEHKKPVLCEKAFCLNYQQAEEVIRKARENHVFVCEAMCPAFLPSRKILNDLLHSGIIGEVKSSYSVFGNYLLNVERVREKNLGGGALLDIGIYPLYFTLSTFGYCYIHREKD
jgi:predicted dehydrogenase